jgi:hypothetical protein
MATVNGVGEALVYKKICGLYYKDITIVNDGSKVIRMTIVSDSNGVYFEIFTIVNYDPS